MSKLKVNKIEPIGKGPLVVGGDLIVSGAITTNTIITSAITTNTITVISGSTFNGNSEDNPIDQLWVNNGFFQNLSVNEANINKLNVNNIGSSDLPLTVNNSLEIDGSVKADYFYGDGSNLTNLPEPPVTDSIGEGSLTQKSNSDSKSFGNSSASFGTFNTANGDSSFTFGIGNQVGRNSHNFLTTQDPKYLVIFENVQNDFVVGKTKEFPVTIDYTTGTTVTSAITTTTMSQILTGQTGCTSFFISLNTGQTGGTFSYIDCSTGNRLNGTLTINNSARILCARTAPKTSSSIRVIPSGNCCTTVIVTTSTTVTTVTTSTTGVTFNTLTGRCYTYLVTNNTGILFNINYTDCNTGPSTDKFVGSKYICSSTYPTYVVPSNWTGSTNAITITPLNTICCKKYNMLPNFIGSYFIEHEPCCGQQTLITGFTNYTPFTICSQSTPLVTRIYAPNYPNASITIDEEPYTLSSCPQCQISGFTVSSTSVSYTSVTVDRRCAIPNFDGVIITDMIDPVQRISGPPTCKRMHIRNTGVINGTVTWSYLDCLTQQPVEITQCASGDTWICTYWDYQNPTYPSIIRINGTVISTIGQIINVYGACCSCDQYAFYIDSRDVLAASGNTGVFSQYNNKVFLDYYDCEGNETTIIFTAGSYYNFCMSNDIKTIGNQNFMEHDFWSLYYIHDASTDIGFSNKELKTQIPCLTSSTKVYSSIQRLFLAPGISCCDRLCSIYEISVGNRSMSTRPYKEGDYIVYENCNGNIIYIDIPTIFNLSTFYVCSIQKPSYVGDFGPFVNITKIGNQCSTDCIPYEFRYNNVRGGLCVWTDCHNILRTTTITQNQVLRVCAIRGMVGGKADVRVRYFSPGCPQLVTTANTNTSYMVIESFDGGVYSEENYVYANAKIHNGQNLRPVEIKTISNGNTNIYGQVTTVVEGDIVVLMDGVQTNTPYTLLELTESVPTDFESGMVASSVFGEASMASGLDTSATGNASVSQNISTTAIGDGSHAEGIETASIGLGSHSEGQMTNASGDYSHAEGIETKTNGKGSATKGYRTSANGDFSMSIGSNTVAGSNEYNFLKVENTNYLLIMDGDARDNFVTNNTKTYFVNTNVLLTGTTILTSTTVTYETEILPSEINCFAYLINNQSGVNGFQLSINYIDCGSGAPSIYDFPRFAGDYNGSSTILCSTVIPTYQIPPFLTASTNQIQTGTTIELTGTCCDSIVRTTAFTVNNITTTTVVRPTYNNNCFTYEITNRANRSIRVEYKSCISGTTKIVTVQNNKTVRVCSSIQPSWSKYLPYLSNNVTITRKDRCCPEVFLTNNTNNAITWTSIDCCSGTSVTRVIGPRSTDYIRTSTVPPFNSPNIFWRECDLNNDISSECYFCESAVRLTPYTSITNTIISSTTVTTACTGVNITTLSSDCVTYRFENFNNPPIPPLGDNIFWTDCNGVDMSLRLDNPRQYVDVCAIKDSAHAITGISVTQIYSGCCLYEREIPFSVLHNFSGNTIIDVNFNSTPANDGAQPYGTLLNVNGSLFGTATEDGDSTNITTEGIIFSCDTNGNNYEILYRFKTILNPITSAIEQFSTPEPGLILASDGLLYGAVSLFSRISPAPSYTRSGALYSFNINTRQCNYLRPLNIGGRQIKCELTERSSEPGFLYGITHTENNLHGHTVNGQQVQSVVIFKYDIVSNILIDLFDLFNSVPSYSNYIEVPNLAFTQLYELSSDPGALYGTTNLGGTYGDGTIFRYDINLNTVTIVHNFSLFVDGAYPQFSKWVEKNGTLYGTTTLGTGSIFSNGTLFTYHPVNGFNKIFDFPTSCAVPANIMLASDGKIYGNALSGFRGVIFSFDLDLNNIFLLRTNFTLLDPNVSRSSTLIEIDNCLYGVTTLGGIFRDPPQTQYSNGKGTIYTFCIPQCSNNLSYVSSKSTTENISVESVEPVNANAIINDYLGNKTYVEITSITDGLTSQNGYVIVGQAVVTDLPENASYTLLEINSDISINEGTIVSNYFGENALSSGLNTEAVGNASVSQNVNTSAQGDGSHAEGNLTSSYGDYSHSEGIETTSAGEGSHAEGNKTFANGKYSHAEGLNTIANGMASSSEGFNTIANGDYSKSMGNNTSTGAKEQVFRKIENTDYLLILNGDAQDNFILGNTKSYVNSLTSTGTTTGTTGVTVVFQTEILPYDSDCDAYLIENYAQVIGFQLTLNYIDCTGNTTTYSFPTFNGGYTGSNIVLCSKIVPTYTIPSSLSASTSIIESGVTITKSGQCCSTILSTSAITTTSVSTIAINNAAIPGCYTYEISNRSGRTLVVNYTSCLGKKPKRVNIFNNSTVKVCSYTKPSYRVPTNNLGITMIKTKPCCPEVTITNRSNEPVTWVTYDCCKCEEKTITINSGSTTSLATPIVPYFSSPNVFWDECDVLANWSTCGFCFSNTGCTYTSLTDTLITTVTVTTACTDSISVITYTGDCVTYRFENFNQVTPPDDNVFWTDCSGFTMSLRLDGYRSYVDVCAIKDSAYAITGITVTQIYSGCCLYNTQSNLDLVHSFSGLTTLDGFNSIGDLLHLNGSIYGTTYKGGAGNRGIIFSCDTNGNNYEILHSFTTVNNKTFSFPYPGLILAKNGLLYGTVDQSISLIFSKCGIYSFDLSTKQCQYLNDLTQTVNPRAKLMERIGEVGFLYGVGYTYPLIYKYDIINDLIIDLVNLYLLPSGPQNSYTQLYELDNDPDALYGTTERGGSFDDGTYGGVIFRYDITGNTATIVHSFNPPTDGSNPSFLDWAVKDGTLYGSTNYGGIFSAGTLFSYHPVSGFTKLFDFPGGVSIGSGKSLMFGSDGKIYGLAGGGDPGSLSSTNGPNGAIYSYDLSTGIYNLIHSFLGTPNEPRYSVSTPLEIDGCLYGNSIEGGMFTRPQYPLGAGTVYRLCISGCSDQVNFTTVNSSVNTVIDDVPNIIQANATISDGSGNVSYVEIVSISGGTTSENGEIIIDDITVSYLPENTEFTLLKINSETPNNINDGIILSNYFGEGALSSGIDTNAKGVASRADGINNVANGKASYAGGINSKTNNTAELAISNGGFGTLGSSQYSIVLMNGFTSGDTPSWLYVDGISEHLTIEANTTVYAEILVHAVIVNCPTMPTIIGSSFAIPKYSCFLCGPGNSTAVCSFSLSQIDMDALELGPFPSGFQYSNPGDNNGVNISFEILSNSNLWDLRWTAMITMIQTKFK